MAFLKTYRLVIFSAYHHSDPSYLLNISLSLVHHPQHSSARTHCRFNASEYWGGRRSGWFWSCGSISVYCHPFSPPSTVSNLKYYALACFGLKIYRLLVSATRKNAFVLYIVYELGIVGEYNLSIIWDGPSLSDATRLGVLWLLWVIAAGLTIKRKNQLLGGFSCSFVGEFCKHTFWLSIHLLNTHMCL